MIEATRRALKDARHFGLQARVAALEEQNTRMRAALIEAGKHINSLRDEWSETDCAETPLPEYIEDALKV